MTRELRKSYDLSNVVILSREGGPTKGSNGSHFQNRQPGDDTRSLVDTGCMVSPGKHGRSTVRFGPGG